MNIKNLIFKFILNLILFVLISYIFTIIHEGGHIITAILLGNEIDYIIITPFGGCTYIYSGRWSYTIGGFPRNRKIINGNDFCRFSRV